MNSRSKTSLRAFKKTDNVLRMLPSTATLLLSFNNLKDASTSGTGTAVKDGAILRPEKSAALDEPLLVSGHFLNSNEVRLGDATPVI